MVNECYCGCGEMARPWRQFRPGHDAKLRSQLLKHVRAGGDILDAPMAEIARNPAFLRVFHSGDFAEYVEPKDWARI